MLFHLLHLQGIHSIVIEDRSRQRVEERVRAGVLERNDGFYFSLDGKRHRINMTELIGRHIIVYAQQAARSFFDIEELSLRGIDASRPSFRFTHDGEPCEILCDFVGGCDGSHSICRSAIPDGALR